jgi:hypothetical protein
VGVFCLGIATSERNRLDRAERDQLFLAALISSADDAPWHCHQLESGKKKYSVMRSPEDVPRDR